MRRVIIVDAGTATVDNLLDRTLYAVHYRPVAATPYQAGATLSIVLKYDDSSAAIPVLTDVVLDAEQVWRPVAEIHLYDGSAVANQYAPHYLSGRLEIVVANGGTGKGEFLFTYY